MTPLQFNLLAQLTKLTAAKYDAAFAALVDGVPLTETVACDDSTLAEFEEALDALRDLERKIRGAFVLHAPMEFRVMVGHHDTHRPPGSLNFDVGQIVRLVAHSTERWIPVRIDSIPAKAGGYYEGVITEQLVVASKFQVGDRCRFSEDQVELPASHRQKRRVRRSYAW